MSIETEKGIVPPTEAPSSGVTTRDKKWGLSGVDVILRVVLLGACITAVLVMVTSKETQIVMTPLGPVPVPAKFQQSSAFIYFIVALSVAGLYSIITAIFSLSLLSKPNFPAKLLLILIVLDVIILGIVAAAIGTAGGVGYIGLKGNNHLRWNKVCNTYSKFCRYVGGSIFASLAAGVVLVVLVIFNSHCLYRRIPQPS